MGELSKELIEMKCIFCDKKADRVYHGHSFCEKHFKEEVKQWAAWGKLNNVKSRDYVKESKEKGLWDKFKDATSLRVKE